MAFWSRNHVQGRGAATLSAALIALAISGCNGPAAEKSTPAPRVEAEAVPRTQAAQELLAKNLPVTGATWYMAEGLTAEASKEPATVSGQRTVRLSASPTSGLHRIGLKFSESAAPTTINVTIWAKSSPGIGATVEAAGVTMSTKVLPADYGIGFVDLMNNVVGENVLVTDKTRLNGLAIKSDGEWRRISFPFRSRDKDIYINLAAVVGGTQVFKGSPDQQLIIGGIEVAPAS